MQMVFNAMNLEEVTNEMRMSRKKGPIPELQSITHLRDW
jgi:hypothetical protein